MEQVTADRPTLAVQQGRHPILARLVPDGTIPNDTFMQKDQNFTLITGANGSGKSTYIKQTALLCIMSAVGSFVPAVFFSR